jgi:hypothetical protein
MGYGSGGRRGDDMTIQEIGLASAVCAADIGVGWQCVFHVHRRATPRFDDMR